MKQEHQTKYLVAEILANVARRRSTEGSWYLIYTQQHNADTDRSNVHAAHCLITHELRACAYERVIACVLVSECRMCARACLCAGCLLC